MEPANPRPTEGRRANWSLVRSTRPRRRERRWQLRGV